MAEILSPGIFIEEVPSQATAVQAVSTSNMGILGATQRGPTNVATLVTSFPQYQRIFGEQIAESRTHLSMAAFYANGGKRAFVTRVMPADAVSASADIRSSRENSRILTGDGVITVWTDASAGADALATFVAPSSVSMRYRSNGTPVVEGVLRNRADGADVALVASVQKYEARIAAGSLPTFDPSLPAVAPGATVTLTYDPGTGDASIALTAPTGNALTSTTTTGQGTVIKFDFVSGFLSVEFAGTEVVGGTPVGNLRLDFTPLTATRTITDDGAGALTATGVISAGTIDYDTGEYGFTTEATYHIGDGCPLLASYEVQAWSITPISVGTWANDMRVSISGNADFYSAASATYTRFDVAVLLRNSSTGNFDIVEVFEEISFSDSTSAQYFPSVVNDLSDLIEVAPAIHAEAPAQLSGVGITETLAGGDEATGNRLITRTLSSPISPRSMVISYATAAGVAKTIVDNGNGLLTGDVDPAGTNTVNYTSGAISVTLSDAANAASLVLVTYYKAPDETTHTEAFGDTTKNYTDGSLVEHYLAGTDGTFDSTQWGRSQFTSSALLSATYQGLYAFDRVDELLQIVVPDYVGDVTITKDILDYVDSRATGPAGGDRFAVLAVPVGSSAQEAVDFLRYDINQFSKFAAIYWPWVKVADPLKNNRSVVFPPVAHIAGIYARTDNNRNVGKAPGGTVDGALRFLTALEMVPTQGERDFVYPNRINPLISSAQTGLAVWGVRTMAQEAEWRYINVRRLFMFVERSVYNSTHWIVFENNGPALWARIKAQLQGFLSGLFADGMLAGNTPAQAFYVIVDESNNTTSTIDAGQVIIDVGIAANKPAEFARFRFTQKTVS